jgi:hypothetical protein
VLSWALTVLLFVVGAWSHHTYTSSALEIQQMQSRLPEEIRGRYRPLVEGWEGRQHSVSSLSPAKLVVRVLETRWPHHTYMLSPAVARFAGFLLWLSQMLPSTFQERLVNRGTLCHVCTPLSLWMFYALRSCDGAYLACVLETAPAALSHGFGWIHSYDFHACGGCDSVTLRGCDHRPVSDV